MTLTIVERPGYSGKKRDEKHATWNKKYGKWETMWQWNGTLIDKLSAYQIYEDSYYEDSFKNEDIWQSLIRKAREVYDIEERDVESGLDYLIQKGPATHLQDISIRRVLMRRGWKFRGKELAQVRKHNTHWGGLFSPGVIDFHLPKKIVTPHLKKWWRYNSVEDFYQSNKVIVVDK